jgi:hypothetical protein
VFTARYALSPYIKQIRFVFKGLNWNRLLRREVTKNWRKVRDDELRYLYHSLNLFGKTEPRRLIWHMRGTRKMHTSVWFGQKARKEATVMNVLKELCYLCMLLTTWREWDQGNHGDGFDILLTCMLKKLLSAEQNTKIHFEAWTRAVRITFQWTKTK